MAVISNLSVSLSANLRGLEKGLKKARRKIKSFAGSIANIKTAVVAALGVGSVGAVMDKALSAWREQEQAVASLQAANESMGRSTRDITGEMVAQAQQLQKEGIIGDESIIQGQSILSTFETITDDLMPRATRLMVDLMAKTGRSGAAAANMIGKASMGQVGALQIAGITVSETTKSLQKNEATLKRITERRISELKSAIASQNIPLNFDGRGLSRQAQTAMDKMNAMSREVKKLEESLREGSKSGSIFESMLNDIESQVGGANKALGKTNTGGIDQLSNAIGDKWEEIGDIITTGVAPFARQLALDMGLVALNTDEAGRSFRESLVSIADGIGPLLEKLNGINLIWKALKLGVSTFGLAFIAQIKHIADALNFLPSKLGFDLISKENIGFLNELHDGMLDSVSDMRRDLGRVYDEVENRTLSRDFQQKLDAFKQRAEETAKGLETTSTPTSIQKTRCCWEISSGCGSNKSYSKPKSYSRKGSSNR